MALFLSERDVQELFPMKQALLRIEASFVAQQSGRAVNQPRQRVFQPGFSLHYMAAALADEHLAGMKIYTIVSGAARFLVLLFDTKTGDLLAVIEADYLGRIRTGAASGVATKYLARQDASAVGLIGAGRQARTQLEAVAGVRKIRAARVFARDEKHRVEFCREMADYLDFPVEPAASAEDAARFGDIVIAATTSREPVIKGEWLRPGTHVNAIGANMADRRELDDAALRQAEIIAVDSIAQARDEAGDLVQGLKAANQSWDDVMELNDIVTGIKPRRESSEQITVFKSCGIAIWDVMAAGFIYREALEKKKGKPFAIWEDSPR
ncbi:MAG: ornithine cyclodeaminase family protein [Acidobacteria bacterium]|nr:MAG: ornithine cyclodeaminase family protein [Acidobacteriota bacterium]